MGIQLKEDFDLVLAAQKGNSESFGRLYDIYIKKIYDFIYYKTLNKDVAEDITSLVFLKAWDKIAQFKNGSFAAWLYMIARNSVIDHYRQQKVNVNIEDCWDIADKNDFLGQVDQNLNIEIIREAMKCLKNQEREVLIMRFWLGLSFKEIAERLDKSEGAIKMTLGRSLKILKTKIPLLIIILWPGIINICKKLN